MTSPSEIRKYINILTEARKDSPHINYELSGKSKAATARKEFEKITATLTGPESAKFTKLAKQYKVLDMISKRASERRDALNEKTKKAVDDLFDVQDEILTRVVDSVSVAVTVAKSTQDEEVTTSTFDKEGFIDELTEKLSQINDGALIPILKELEERYTIIETKIKKGKPGRLASVKVKEAEGDDIFSALENYASQFKSKITPILDSIGQELDQMKQQVS
jgi:hypothetical protein